MTRITAVRSRMLRIPPDNPTSFSNRTVYHRDHPVVEVECDDGHAGIGFCYAGNSNGQLVTSAIDNLFSPLLIGQDPFRVEGLWAEMYQESLLHGRAGSTIRALSMLDIALWDHNARAAGLPLYKLLGGYKDSIPCYASTYHGDHQPDGLSTPEAFADFAEHCLDLGYPAFKIHGWGRAPVSQEVANVHAVGKRVGDKMDLMLDPACELMTFGDAVKVGWACDENRFFWYEDPYRDGGISQFAHRKLRQLITTPILQTEHVRSLEPHIDFALADATDYVRGDVGYDGITGVIKLAHACEALGIDLEFHGPGPAQRQCMASIRNTNYYEMGLLHPKAPASHEPELYIDYRDELDAIDANGHVPVPQGPGLGVEINWDWVERNRVSVVEW